jgi:putative ATP-dependent endonuclease of OLD family
LKIEKVEISKFRSIEKGVFNLNKVNAIVGQNNSGKSALMRALNSFFNPQLEIEHFNNDTNLYTSKRSVPRITITFNSIPNKPIYQPFLINGKITLKQEYNKKSKKLIYNAVNNGNIAISDQQIIEIFEDIQFVLIPTERHAKNNTDNEISVLRKLLDTFFSTHTAKRDTLTPKVKEAFNYFQKNALSKVSSGIENKYLASKGLKVSIDSRFPLSYDLFVNDLSIKIKEDDKEFKLEECGSGIQSLVSISIYKYLAELNHTNFIIGIEEPEINLHPQAQKELVFTLLEEANANNIQIVCTSHSTVLIDQLEHSDIILVRKEKDLKRKFKTTIHQISPNFWQQNDIEIIQYDKFHKFRNSEFFFANHVMITESPIDSEVFRTLLATKGIILEKSGVSVLELGGIKSLKYAYYLLRDLDIPKTIIVDKDFFFNYQNGDKENSRYTNGFFNYDNVYTDEPLITEIITEQSKRDLIEGLLTSNHSRALDETLKYDIICMKYNLEMDLVASNKAKQLIYAKLNIPNIKQNSNSILTEYKKKIKKIPLLIHVINNLPQANLPNSYKRLIRRFKDVTK